ncbi:MAG: hypothetical protein V1800_08050 [Candidatus Latescibacterota bacterium]
MELEKAQDLEVLAEDASIIRFVIKGVTDKPFIRPDYLPAPGLREGAKIMDRGALFHDAGLSGPGSSCVLLEGISDLDQATLSMGGAGETLSLTLKPEAEFSLQVQGISDPIHLYRNIHPNSSYGKPILTNDSFVARVSRIERSKPKTRWALSFKNDVWSLNGATATHKPGQWVQVVVRYGKGAVHISLYDDKGRLLLEKTSGDWFTSPTVVKLAFSGRAAIGEVWRTSVDRRNALALVPSTSGEPDKDLYPEPRGGWVLEQGNNGVVATSASLGIEIGRDDSRRWRVRIWDRATGVNYADGPIHLSFRSGNCDVSPEAQRLSVIETHDARHVLLVSQDAALRVDHRLTFPRDLPWFEEKVLVRNVGSAKLSLDDYEVVFTRPLDFIAGEAKGLEGYHLMNVPFYHKPEMARAVDDVFTPADLVERLPEFLGVWNWGEFPYNPLPRQFAQGWAFANGRRGVLLVKYTQDDLEASTVSATKVEGHHELRIGGSARWGFGHPERMRAVAVGEFVNLGATRWQVVNGDFRRHAYAFREFMDEKGHNLLADFNPPVQWNEIYDLGWIPGSEEQRAPHYTTETYEKEAAKAAQYSAEALYLDPGWDFYLAEGMWAGDPERDRPRNTLLPLPQFTELMRTKYRLGVAVHAPYAPWTDKPSDWGDAYKIQNADGALDNVGFTLCGSSRKYLDEKTRRSAQLARYGIGFFMIDGSFRYYSGWHENCHSPDHGHGVPDTDLELFEAYKEHCRRIHRIRPEIQIEMHDILCPTRMTYTPQYFGHSKETWNTIWGFELMWDPMSDLLGGYARSLYYYNLAYHIPIYLHIDLRPDNQYTTELWWFISTIRHLGIGGTHPDETTRQRHIKSMAKYAELGPFYKRGEFWGFGEDVHVHTMPTHGNGWVINVFNTCGAKGERIVTIPWNGIGLPAQPGAPVRVCTADGNTPAAWSGAATSEMIRFTIDLPEWGNALIEIGDTAATAKAAQLPTWWLQPPKE